MRLDNYRGVEMCASPLKYVDGYYTFESLHVEFIHL